MRKLGLKFAALLVIPLGTGCTKAANPESVQPSASVAVLEAPSSAPSVASAPPPTATSSATPSSAAAPSGAASKTYDDTTRSIDASVGDRFTLNLPANVTTPYKWVAAPSEPALVLAERHYEDKPPAGCQGCVGYPGTDRLTFEAKQAGTTTLVLRYAPLRGKEPGERELSIKVTVK